MGWDQLFLGWDFISGMGFDFSIWDGTGWDLRKILGRDGIRNFKNFNNKVIFQIKNFGVQNFFLFCSLKAQIFRKKTKIFKCK